MTATDPILDSDLNAYVDGQLSAERAIEVETYLSRNPAKAAEVMADLRLKGELRLAFASGPDHGRAETRHAARRLNTALVQRQWLFRLQRVAAIALLVAGGWFANAHFGPFRATAVVAAAPAPAFVEEAVRAHQTAALRGTMPSQAETARYDPRDIRSATAIVMPDVPAEWAVSDVQIFPSAFGPSVEMALKAGKAEHVSLFAVRPGTFAVQDVQSITADTVRAAYWQIGDVAYALVSSEQDADTLTDAARKLARTLY